MQAPRVANVPGRVAKPCCRAPVDELTLPLKPCLVATMGTLTTIFVIASLILVAITMFAGFMGIVGPRTSASNEQGGSQPRRRFRKAAATPDSPAANRRAA